MVVSNSTDNIGRLPARSRPSVGSWLIRQFTRNKTMSGGIVIVIIAVLMAVFAPLLTTKAPKTMHTLERLQPPSSEDWFGTDHFGRDVYSRTIYGARVSIIVGTVTAILTLAVGGVIGLVAGYIRPMDAIIMRIMDALMAIPGLLLAIALVALLGASMQNTIVALTVTGAPGTARMIRASVLSLRSQLYVDAAQAHGVSTTRILIRHILPNAWAPIIVMGTFAIPGTMLTEAGLSFLGAGTPPEIPSWGNMIAEGRRFMRSAVWIMVFPGICLSLTTVGVNLLGDALRDRLDPRLRGSMEMSEPD